MGKAKAPEFDSFVNLQKLKDELSAKGYTTKDVAKILDRASVGNVRSILNGTVALKTSDLTRILDEAGIYLQDVVDENFKHLLKD